MKIRLINLCKSFSSSFKIEKLNITIGDGEFTTLLGPSGCGKTTILRMIAGLETPDTGEIYFDDICVFSDEKNINTPPEKRNLGFVFQDFALWPHMTVFENVAYSLRAKSMTKNLQEQVSNALETVRLDGFESRYPKELSGGQQQRVALARAIVGKPECILFDEPLSALDAILRDSMRTEMKRITKQVGATAVFVTHDQLEAMSMSDSIVVLNKGSVEQIGSPEEIYLNPSSKFVAQFIGKSNWIDHSSMVRPEKIRFEGDHNSIEYKAKVVSVEFLGSSYELYLEGRGFKWKLLSKERKQLNDELSLFVHKDHILTFREVH